MTESRAPWQGRQLAWVLMICGLMSGCATKPPDAAGCHLTELAALPVTFIEGEPTVHVKIAGHDEVMMVDTGAYASVLTEKTNDALGAREIFTDDQLEGVGGLANIAASHPGDLQIGGILVKDPQFLVVRSIFPRDPMPGVNGQIGQDTLKFYDIGLDFPHNRLNLYLRNSCRDAFPFSGYFSPSPSHWTESQQVLVPVAIDQHDFQLLIDTGSDSTAVWQKSLDRQGVHGVAVGKTDHMYGIGQAAEAETPERFDSVTIGAEEIDNAVLGVDSRGFDDDDGLIGESYFRTHQVYIANDSQTVYFGTYMAPQTAAP